MSIEDRPVKFVAGRPECGLAVAECVRDAEEALTAGALLAVAAGDEDLRTAFLLARSVLREGLGEPAN
jgi:hypothetical protein